MLQERPVDIVVLGRCSAGLQKEKRQEGRGGFSSAHFSDTRPSQQDQTCVLTSRCAPSEGSIGCQSRGRFAPATSSFSSSTPSSGNGAISTSRCSRSHGRSSFSSSRVFISA